MRLLRTDTLRLEEFFNVESLNYSILSHTWELDEVLYHDMCEGKAESKAGFSKLKGACTQAATDGYKYIWIDTCCIDKESSAELSESINSMYQWYKNADICYVFLKDVSVDIDSVILEGNFPEAFQIQFAKSKWFTRGWTLQELIAPPEVVLYDRDWHHIGTKLNLKIILSSITGIDVDVLSGSSDIHKLPIAQRMSWASKRQTTRPEDIAYSLLGLFNVNMPLLYGEGRKSFIRLQEEIMKDSDDHSIFAWKAISSPQIWKTTIGAVRGLLATSPAEFRNSAGIVPIFDLGESMPYAMTNKGLSIRLGILERAVIVNGTHHPAAILKCWADSSRKPGVGISLMFIGGNQYGRLQSENLHTGLELEY